MGRFRDKRILITGGTSGMGLVGARRVIAEGGTVLLTGLNEERLTSAKLEFQDKAVVIRNDAAEPTATALAQTVASVGPLDGLWLNAAYATLGSRKSWSLPNSTA